MSAIRFPFGCSVYQSCIGGSPSVLCLSINSSDHVAASHSTTQHGAVSRTNLPGTSPFNVCEVSAHWPNTPTMSASTGYAKAPHSCSAKGSISGISTGPSRNRRPAACNPVTSERPATHRQSSLFCCPRKV